MVSVSYNFKFDNLASEPSRCRAAFDWRIGKLGTNVRKVDKMSDITD